MARDPNIAVTLAILMLAMPVAGSWAMSLPEARSASAVVPAASSNAHRPGPGGTYGGLKPSGPNHRSLGRPPPLPPGSTIGRRNRIKPPYPYRYYDDTKRGNYGCHWLARRAIETNNRNWLTRYRACIVTGTD